MRIRRIEKTDLDKYTVPLSELGAATFTDSFGHLYDPADLTLFVQKNHSITAYRHVISDPDHFVWIAQDNDKLIGYLVLAPNDLPTDPPVKNALELARLYVRTSHHGQGIGQALLDAAIPFAQKAGFANMVLSVWSENYGGHRFYLRNGFEKIGEYQFPVGNHLDDEWIMRKRL